MPDQNYFDQFEKHDSSNDYFSQFDEHKHEPSKTLKEVNNEPSDYTGGFLKSIFGGEAPLAGLKGGMGFLKGAVLDIPESLYNTAKGAYNLVTNPKETLSNIPSDVMNALSSAKQSLMESGANPFEFGEMMGQLTGQPAVMAELPSMTPKAIKASGPLVEGTGSFMKNYAPVSRSIPFLRYGIPFSKDIEKFIGSGIESLGNKMRGSSSIEPNLVYNKSGYKAGVDLSANEPLDFGSSPIQRDMPNTSGYRPGSLPDENAPVVRKSILTNEDLKDLPNEGNISGYKVIRNERPLSDIATEFLSKKKKVRVNSDGTFTDMDTGEMFDKKGNSIVEINGEPASEFKPVEPKNIQQIIRTIPKSGNIEFDSALNKLQSLRSILDSRGLTDAELAQYNNAAGTIRNHPDMPKELSDLWNKYGAENEARGPKFKVGDQVKMREKSKATDKPKLAFDKNSSFFFKNRSQ